MDKNWNMDVNDFCFAVDGGLISKFHIGEKEEQELLLVFEKLFQTELEKEIQENKKMHAKLNG